MQHHSPMAVGPSCSSRCLTANEWAIASTRERRQPRLLRPAAGLFRLVAAAAADDQFNANGAESAIEISWSAPIGNVADIAYYQALCAKADGSAGSQRLGQAVAALHHRAQPVRRERRHHADPSNVVVPVTGDGGVPTDAAIRCCCRRRRDTDSRSEQSARWPLTARSRRSVRREHRPRPRRRCASTTSRTACPTPSSCSRSTRPATPHGTYFSSTLTPQPVTDFWEDLHDKNDHIEGGFCLLAEHVRRRQPADHDAALVPRPHARRAPRTVAG